MLLLSGSFEDTVVSSESDLSPTDNLLEFRLPHDRLEGTGCRVEAKMLGDGQRGGNTGDGKGVSSLAGVTSPDVNAL